ncbi:hypothetical protein QBC44DRAFT_303996 [Cladorrhinum sp. PSN332]|nr:hypothetical protein QBC44DRAFT_303996 [Cladorrhinum sp. PSN332]
MASSSPGEIAVRDSESPQTSAATKVECDDDSESMNSCIYVGGRALYEAPHGNPLDSGIKKENVIMDDEEQHETRSEIIWTWDSHELPSPETTQELAMMNGCEVRKGQVVYDYLGSDDETWNSVNATPSRWMYDRKPDGLIKLDGDGVHIKKETIPDPSVEVHYRLNFHDPASRNDDPPDDCFQSRLGIPGVKNGMVNKDQVNLPVEANARTASLIYLVGQIRLGDARCDRCKQHEVTREGFSHPAITHINNPIPFCTTAVSYFNGICSPCFAEGGTEEDMLRRCSVARRNNDKVMEILEQDGHPLAKVVGSPVLIGIGSEHERAAVREALFGDLPVNVDALES